MGWIYCALDDCLTFALFVQKFIKDCFDIGSDVEALGGPTGYDDLLNSDLLDAVYIPLPTR
jgi:hypothetical protein